MHSDHVLYSPGVPVFRTDDGELLDEPWEMGIITCAAVNGIALRDDAPEREPEIPAVMRARTHRVLAVAVEQGQRRLILGAWGCGAFGLDTEMMAAIFSEALAERRGAFDEVVFAITDWSSEQRFIGPFRRAFTGESQESRHRGD